MLSRFHLLTIAFMLTAAAGTHAATYKLQAVQSREIYGPFAYKSDTFIKVESGIFKVNIVSGRTFRLTSTDTGRNYGVYELVPGRIIDIGDRLFAITDIKSPPPPAAESHGQAAKQRAATSSSVFANGAIALEYELLDIVGYDWKLAGVSGASQRDLERNTISLKFRHNYLTGRLGLVTDSEWDHTLSGNTNTFSNASMSKGTGWVVGLGVEIPVIDEGRWKASVFGEVSYRQEKLSLQYSENILSTISTTTTNGTVVSTNTASFQRATAYNVDATLTEMYAALGGSVSYESDRWFFYVGIRALPWIDTDLDATISSTYGRYAIEFERTDPVSGYGGIGFNVAGTKCYVEAEGGGENAIRVGLLREL
ncbi:MAG: hypothetical protein HN341_09325 [Verrucomicrobia bacterium]|jgi:hypothetical protein|nr:hypothetical protein [Verrucomicrobiota bacterium]MBT7065531.1 hypothetical protein [Verrucomicrobiota bacterium]